MCVCVCARATLCDDLANFRGDRYVSQGERGGRARERGHRRTRMGGGLGRVLAFGTKY